MAPTGDLVVDISSGEDEGEDKDLFIDLPQSDVLLGGHINPVTMSRMIGDICGIEDIDELMVISEISAPPVLQKIAKPDEDDDDCVVLDGDPDKAVTANDEGSVGDDEVQIVALKGPEACRDFPHSRHLCSNLPFSTTSHVKHCTMCHCFVCDAPAPCKYWGNSTTADDHCHATDKDSKWTYMRKIFKQKVSPAFTPEKHQNGVYSTTMTPPRQQPMQSRVSGPQLPSVSPGSHPSLSIQSPLLNEGSQNQQRHPSVRVSLSVGATVSSPRAGRGTGNAHIAQSTHSHAIFKRAGAVAPVFATRNASQFSSSAPDDLLVQQALSPASRPVQVAPTTNAFTGTSQNNHFQRSFSAPIAPEVQPGQPAAHYQGAINGLNALEPQLARSTSLTTQRTQSLPEPAIIDVDTASWCDILVTVASNLAVADYNISIPESQHVTVDSQTMRPTANHGFDDATCGSVQADGSVQASENSDHLVGQSNPVPNEAHLNDFAPVPNESYLNDFVGAPADELPIEEVVHQPEISRLESTNILFEFDWE